MTPLCTCYPTPEHMHFVHYGATEPGSALEPNPECPAHFPATRWLEKVREDVALMVTDFDAADRVDNDHAPAMLHALEGIQDLIRPQWRSMDYDRNALIDDIRKIFEREGS